MKKIKKRIIALVMALTMMFPCTAFAAEPTNDAVQQESISVLAEEGYSDFNIEKHPLNRSITYISTSGSNLSNGATYSDHFVLARDSQIISQLSVSGTARLVIKVSSSSWSTQYTYLDETISNGTSSKISNATYDQGTHVWVYLYIQQDNTSYTLNMSGT